jgi:hypothetical protein
VRQGALRGWAKCDDGRLYHPVVAEKANEAWGQKLGFKWRKDCDRIRKENIGRVKQGLAPLEMPNGPVDGKKKVASSVTAPAAVSAGIPKETIEPSNGIPAESVAVSAGIPAENALNGPDHTGPDLIQDNNGSLRSPFASDGNSTAIAEAKSKLAPEDAPSPCDITAAHEAGIRPGVFALEWPKFLDDFRARGLFADNRPAEWTLWLGKLAARGLAPKSSLTRAAIDTLASEFYTAYPKHVDPDEGKAKFVKLVKSGSDPHAIIAATKRYAEACLRAGEEKRFIPSPARWLNKGGFKSEDLPQPARAGPASSTPRSNGGDYLAKLSREYDQELEFGHVLNEPSSAKPFVGITIDAVAETAP